MGIEADYKDLLTVNGDSMKVLVSALGTRPTDAPDTQVFREAEGNKILAAIIKEAQTIQTVARTSAEMKFAMGSERTSQLSIPNVLENAGRMV